MYQFIKSISLSKYKQNLYNLAHKHLNLYIRINQFPKNMLIASEYSFYRLMTSGSLVNELKTAVASSK